MDLLKMSLPAAGKVMVKVVWIIVDVVVTPSFTLFKSLVCASKHLSARGAL